MQIQANKYVFWCFEENQSEMILFLFHIQIEDDNKLSVFFMFSDGSVQFYKNQVVFSH